MESVPNSIVKLIKSLQLKKYRQKEQLFLVEGEKSIAELSKSDFDVETLIGESSFLERIRLSPENRYSINPSRLSQLSYFKTNNKGIAVVRMKKEAAEELLDVNLLLVLDNIKDPGNLGTIIRIADWYGLSQIVCSKTTVDFYNPKVIAATMGSFTRVNLSYLELEDFLSGRSEPILGASMEGQSIHNINISLPSTLIIGNESQGISSELLKYITQVVSIPGSGSAESLNAAISTGILLDNVIRLSN